MGPLPLNRLYWLFSIPIIQFQTEVRMGFGDQTNYVYAFTADKASTLLST